MYLRLFLEVHCLDTCVYRVRLFPLAFSFCVSLLPGTRGFVFYFVLSLPSCALFPVGLQLTCRCRRRPPATATISSLALRVFLCILFRVLLWFFLPVCLGCFSVSSPFFLFFFFSFFLFSFVFRGCTVVSCTAYSCMRHHTWGFPSGRLDYCF